MGRLQNTIMHVDDSPTVRAVFADQFTELGYEVISVDDPTAVISLLGTHDCRVVVSDIQMPQMDGLDLLRKIKEDDGGISVIMLTGLVGTNCILRAMRWGAEACLFKPVPDCARLKVAVEAAFVKQHGWWSSLQEAHEGTRVRSST